METKEKQIKVGVGAMIFYKDKLLLCRSPKWSSKWVIPGGKMEWGETIEETIKREIKEETELDIKVHSVNEIRTAINPKEFKSKDEIHFVLVDCTCSTDSDKVKINDEHDKFVWVTPEEALKMDLLQYSRRPIEIYLEKQKKEQEQKAKEEEYLAGWQRCKADFKNFQEKAAKDLLVTRENATNDTLAEIIPVLDNFNLALNHLPKEVEKSDWVTGIMHIKRQFENILEQAGVSEIKALGEEFDPAKHECLEEKEVKDKKQDGKVLEVLQKGYQKGEKILRAAKVNVGKLK